MSTTPLIIIIVLLIIVVALGICFFAFRKKWTRVRTKDVAPQRFAYSLDDLLSILGGIGNVKMVHAQLNTVWIAVNDNDEIAWPELKHNFHFRNVVTMRLNVVVIRTDGCAQDLSERIGALLAHQASH